MSVPARSREQREVTATARRYRRDGYKVSRPTDAPGGYGFLGDLLPDLIAERDDDKVVIEIRRADKVVGANDIVELAERVGAQPGWRFELIGLRRPSSVAMPDLELGEGEVERLLDKGFVIPAFVLACAMIEKLAAYASLFRKQKPEAQSLRALVRNLVVYGVIDDDLKQRIDDALTKRDMMLFGTSDTNPNRADVEALVAICMAVRRELVATHEDGAAAGL